MKLLIPLLSLILAHAALALVEPPDDLTVLRQGWEEARTEAQAKVDKLYFEKLAELKKNFVKAGNIEAARAVDSAIKGEAKANNEPEALVKLRGARSKSLKKALTPIDKQYWQDLKKLRGDFQKQGSLAGIDAANAEIKKVLAAYKKPEAPKKKAEVAKEKPDEKQAEAPKEDNNPKAAAILEQAKGKDAQFQYDLAQRYFKGDGVEKDEKVGVELLHLAAEQNHIISCAVLGDRYQHGRDVRLSPKEAAKFYQKAVEQKYVYAEQRFAMYHLGLLYRDGKGVRKDLAKAAELLSKAAEQEDPHATNSLGNMYWNGEGVAKDEDKAVELIVKALSMGIPWEWGGLDQKLKKRTDREKLAPLFLPYAEAGNWRAQYILGKLHRDGDGVTKDKEKAAEWFQKAADQGSKEAKMDLELLK